MIISAIYWAVPKGHMPWRSVWPGALFFAIVTSIGNYVFPLYLDNVSDLNRIGGTIGFILVALVWFYAISLAMLAGAVINSLRHERDDTGRFSRGRRRLYSDPGPGFALRVAAAGLHLCRCFRFFFRIFLGVEAVTSVPLGTWGP